MATLLCFGAERQERNDVIRARIQAGYAAGGGGNDQHRRNHRTKNDLIANGITAEMLRCRFCVLGFCVKLCLFCGTFSYIFSYATFLEKETVKNSTLVEGHLCPSGDGFIILNS